MVRAGRGEGGGGERACRGYMGQVKDYLTSPLDMNFIRSKPLGDAGALDRDDANTNFEGQQARVSNHNTIIYAKPLVCAKDAAASVPRHDAHHLLQALVAPDPAHHEHLGGADMRHGALGSLDKHAKEGFLEREAEVGGGDWVGSWGGGGGSGGRRRRRRSREGYGCPGRTVGVEVFFREGVDASKDAREGAVHAFDGVREVDKGFTPDICSTAQG